MKDFCIELSTVCKGLSMLYIFPIASTISLCLDRILTDIEPRAFSRKAIVGARGRISEAEAEEAQRRLKSAKWDESQSAPLLTSGRIHPTVRCCRFFNESCCFSAEQQSPLYTNTAIMPYSDKDWKAINAIRVLAVRLIVPAV